MRPGKSAGEVENAAAGINKRRIRAGGGNPPAGLGTLANTRTGAADPSGFGGDRVEEGLELTESYRTALAYIFAGQEQIQNAILMGILEHLAQQEDDLLSDAMEDDFALSGMPYAHEPADLLGELQLEEIHILPVERNGLCYIGYAFGCRWDEDGIGVMTCGSRVVEVGSRDTALLCWLAEDDLRHFH